MSGANIFRFLFIYYNGSDPTKIGENIKIKMFDRKY